MSWLLLNQHFVNTDLHGYETYVLEEEVSSEALLAQVLVLDMGSLRIGILLAPSREFCNLVERGGRF